MNRSTLWLLVAALTVLGCGRSELIEPLDGDVPDAPPIDVRDADVPDVPPDVLCRSNLECNDGVFCNGLEECVAGRCRAAVAINCDDGVNCTQDRCDEGGRVCQHVPSDMLCAPGRCDRAMGCTTTGCTTDAQCDDRDPCNGNEVCSAGRCLRTMPMLCDDGNGCTVDVCVAGQGCLSRPDNSRCDDGNTCTNDTCTAGGCSHAVVDRDGDGFAPTGCPGMGGDCDDADPRVNPRTSEVCGDGRDNNCNGLADCADVACRAAPECGMCIPTGREVCGDGRDNDCDRLTDCADPECAMAPGCGMCSPTGPEVCGDGRDNDCDRLTDCADPECAMAPPCRMCSPEADARSCSDGLDEDCDGLIDCRDPDCARFPGCGTCIPTGPEVCSDGRDNDCNGVMDCADRACAGAPSCAMCRPEADARSCSDGVDEDCDGLIDCRDPDCVRFPGCGMCVPTGPEVCGDGRDNDCNGAADCADMPCVSTPACMAPGETCVRPIEVALPSSTAGSTEGRNDDFTPMCASSTAPDVVYSFRNPTRQTVTIDTLGSSYDTMLVVFRGDCASAPIACDDDGSGAGTASRIVLRDAEPGVYFVVVDGWTTSRGAFRLNLSVGAPVEVCDNFRDDDGDRQVDCADTDCVMFPACAMCVPTGPEVCGDGRDNDCDRAVDCADTDCAGSPACCRPFPENNPMTCADGRDNDCDGIVDCADTDCAALPMCCRPFPENNPMTCADGRDNDCDGLIDCADRDCAALPACGAPPPVNDVCAGALAVAVPSTTRGSTTGAIGNYVPQTAGFAGCAGGAGVDTVYRFTVAATTSLTLDTFGSTFDTVLYVRRAPCETGSQIACNDDAMGVDSRVAFTATPGTYYVFVDGFGATSAGAFVLNITVGTPAEDCSNGRDDDGDGQIDCADRDCAALPMCCSTTGPEGMDPFTCLDGRDNDCDGTIDCLDTGCSASPVCCRPTGAENTLAACRDGVDNDCDGITDCRDPDCVRAGHCGCRPTGTQEIGVAQCTDGIDNDCDGTLDCADSDCRPAAATMSGECCNGRDDNGNGLIDEFSCACRGGFDCATVGMGGPFPSNTCWQTTFRICAPRCDMLGGNAFCARLFMGTSCDLRTGECHI